MMNDYRNFDLFAGDELTVIRNAFFSPVFEITDGQFYYGRVITNYNKKQQFSVIETARESWRIEYERKLIIKALNIINSKGENIGSIKRGEQVLYLTDGFNALFWPVRSGVLSPSFGWYNEQKEILMKIKQSPISYKKPFKITFEDPRFKLSQHALLFTLMLIHLAFMDVTRKF